MKIAFNISIIISTLFYVYFILSIVLFNHYRESAKLVQKGPESFELILIIPVLNEEAIIGKTIADLTHQLSQLPATIQAHIIAVDDHSTDNSLQVLTNSQSPYLKVIHRAGREHHGKGAVINTAIQYLQQSLVKDADPERTVIGILDSDAFMSSQDFTEVIARFEQAPKMSMLQTGVGIYNQTNWLTRMQNFEFIGVNSAAQQLRNRLGQGIASGNGQFLRLSLAEKNTWGHSLLEDLEYTLRTWLLGGRVNFTHTIVVQQEGITKLRPFFKQRIRWCQGALQCIRYLPALWRSRYVNKFQKIDTTFWVLTPITGCILPITNLIALLTLIIESIRGFRTGWHHLALITIIMVALFACLYLALIFQRNAMSERKSPALWRAFLEGIGFQGYLLIIALTPYAAVFRQLTGKTGWVKTAHGPGQLHVK
ncbi:glycosyltransferase family 2 protein [Lactiplantibacillus herbarum]|uniref:glycosyltransferase family 2 protein n=1 Tax=Lactiplantibacillus herbarum TaxID=1670446 RepID=UPI000A76AFB8|nr:glycosyltransferase family 2 protein [Lactiplantibacillus herbarum]